MLRDGILMLDPPKKSQQRSFSNSHHSKDRPVLLRVVKGWVSLVCHLLSYSDIHPHLNVPWVGLHNAAGARLTIEKRLDRGPGHHTIFQGLVSFPPPDLVSLKKD